MLIVAHPDDEDNGMLTYLSRGKGARVATLTLNRGEGGQNLMSGDFDDALGLIRTQELLAADRYMDVDQFFGTEVDFGFSKTKEEAFAKWGHDRVLYDVVRAIRLYRPLVIASVFIGEPSDGHGQHQVSGQIAQEAFNAAGDPNVFPDQIAAGLQPWQPLKVYARSPFGRIDAQGMYDYATSQYVPARFTNYVTGKVTTTVPKANVTIPEGDTDPLLGGESYAQLGREGRSLHRSQMGGGAGAPPDAALADASTSEQVRAEAKRRVELELGSQELLERMKLEPGRYKFMRLPLANLGQGQCGAWEDQAAARPDRHAGRLVGAQALLWLSVSQGSRSGAALTAASIEASVRRWRSVIEPIIFFSASESGRGICDNGSDPTCAGSSSRSATAMLSASHGHSMITSATHTPPGRYAALELGSGEADLVGTFQGTHVLRAGRGDRRCRGHV